jgi:DNA-binding beta-propeller fold protein YncE
MAKRAALLGSLLLLASGAQAVELRTGDLLVSDLLGDKILHVDPATGIVTQFSPRDGAENLLDGPAGIAIDPDGAIFVANLENSKLIAIDPRSGAQSDVLVEVGMHPFGLAIRANTDGGSDLRDLYVAAEGAVYQVERSETATTASEFVPSELFAFPRGLTIQEDASGLDALYVAAAAGVVRWVASGGEVDVYYPPPITQFVLDVEWAGELLLAKIFFCGDEGDSGVFAFDGALAPIATGGLVLCPEALTASPLGANLELYVTDNGADGATPTVVKVTETGPASFEQSFIAALPPDTEPAEIVVSPVSFVPEGDATGVALAALAALARLARRR